MTASSLPLENQLKTKRVISPRGKSTQRPAGSEGIPCAFRVHLGVQFAYHSRIHEGERRAARKFYAEGIAQFAPWGRG